jgi:hypothetical protein
VRPAWQAALDAGTLRGIPPAAQEFERHLLSHEDEDHSFLLAEPEELQEELYWFAGHGTPRTMDPTAAADQGYWAARRTTTILAWASSASDARVRDAAAALGRGVPSADDAEPGETGLSVETAAERTLFYRRVLAAWAFLLEVDEQRALQRVRELTRLERTPLP